MPIYDHPSGFMVSLGSGKDRFRAVKKTRGEAEQCELEELLRRRQQKSSAEAQEAHQVSLGAPLVVSRPLVSGKTLQDAYDLTYRLHWRGEKAEKTHKINSASVMSILKPDTPLSSISAEDITELIIELEDMGNSGSTVNKKTSCLSMMFKTAVSQGWLKEYPKPPRRKENQHRVRWLDEDEEAQVLQLCDHVGLHDLMDYVIVAIDTGFRRGELLGFKSKDFANGLLTLHHGKTKSGDARSVPATARVADILRRRHNLEKPFEALTPHSLRYQWEQIRGLMKMDDDPQFVVHMLRHTCASRMVQRTVPLAVVQKWMGHKKIETTLRYAHLAPDSLLQAKEALEGTRGNLVQPQAGSEVVLVDF